MRAKERRFNSAEFHQFWEEAEEWVREDVRADMRAAYSAEHEEDGK